MAGHVQVDAAVAVDVGGLRAFDALGGPAQWAPAETLDGLLEQASKVGIAPSRAALGDDLAGLQQLLTYGLKGTAAYADHAHILGKDDDKVYAFFHEALDYLNRFINYERSKPSSYSPETLNLERVRQLLDQAGRPDRQFRSIHVAGTKGKGSTAAMIEAALRAAGYRTGLYTSPHLHTFRERIRIAGELIPQANFVQAFETVQAHTTDIAGLTWFELVTAIAFQAFAQAAIEVAVIEVGLGGQRFHDLDHQVVVGLAHATGFFDELLNILMTLGFVIDTLIAFAIGADEQGT